MSRNRGFRLRPNFESLEARDLPSFLRPITYHAASKLYGTAIADVNGDQRPDVVSAAYNLDSVVVYLGTGTGRLLDPTYYAIGNAPYQLRVADINSDGKIDVLTTNDTSSSAPQLGVLLGNGDGTFQLHAQIPLPAGTVQLAVSDFNRDGRLDLVTADTDSNRLDVRFGNGDGDFQPAVGWSVAGSYSLETGDINADGWPDIATLGTGTDVANVLINRGDGSFKPPKAYATGDYPFTERFGDVNADGRDDLLVADFYGNTLSLFLANPDGTLQPRIVLPTGSRPFGQNLVDMNRDGQIDIAFVNFGDSTVGVFLGNGDSTFGPRTDYAVGKTDVRTMEIDDLNRDGFLDLVVPTGQASNSYLTVLRNDGQWTAPIPPPTWPVLEFDTPLPAIISESWEPTQRLTSEVSETSAEDVGNWSVSLCRCDQWQKPVVDGDRGLRLSVQDGDILAGLPAVDESI